MAKGTDFGGVHSYTDLHLIQQLVDIQPATPKLNLIDVPGADGSKDLSDQPAGRIVYNDRTLTWTFALYPGEDWHAKHRQVSNALNGRRCKITLDDDPGYYYDGRITVKKYNTDKLLRQITVEAACSPYLLAQEETQRTIKLTTELQTIYLWNEAKPTIPTFSVSSATTLIFNDTTFSVDTGTYRSLDIELQPGTNKLQAKVLSGEGSLIIRYQEGSL